MVGCHAEGVALASREAMIRLYLTEFVIAFVVAMVIGFVALLWYYLVYQPDQVYLSVFGQ